MPETYAYSSDGQARLVMSGWITNLLLYSSAGGKIYAERYARRGGFIGLFQTMGWVAADAQSLGLEIIFQGLLPGTVPALAQRNDGGPDRHQVEVSYWAVGAGVKVDMIGGSKLRVAASFRTPVRRWGHLRLMFERSESAVGVLSTTNPSPAMRSL
jgi:hypothetical protein